MNQMSRTPENGTIHHVLKNEKIDEYTKTINLKIYLLMLSDRWSTNTWDYDYFFKNIFLPDGKDSLKFSSKYPLVPNFYILNPVSQIEIISRCIKRFMENRKTMKYKHLLEYYRSLAGLQEFSEEFSEEFSWRNIPYKVISDEELNDMLEKDDTRTAMLIMSNITDYKPTLKLAITLAELGVFTPGKNKTIDDLPDFEWLNEDDKYFLCDMSEKIKYAKEKWLDWLSLQEKIENYFKFNNKNTT